MGSVVVSEVVHDARFPWSTMMRPGSAHQSHESYNNESHHANNSSASQRLYSPRPNTSQSTTAASQTPQADLTHRSAREAVSTPSSSDGPAQRAQPTSPALPPSADPPPSAQQQPNTESRDSDSSSAASSPSTTASRKSPGSSPLASPTRIKVKSLQHIQSFINEDSTLGDFVAASPSSQEDEEMASPQPQYEISEMPVNDIIEMVAGLLTKITTTNDQQHEHLHRHIPPAEGTTGMSQQTSSVLSFHGKNVPSITILSYLSRIQRYCPTTYEVFLSLLVYFDRMTERVNSGPLQSLRQADRQSQESMSIGGTQTLATRGRSGSSMPIDTTPPSPAPTSTQQRAPEGPPALEPPSPPLSDSEPHSLAHFFVVDSYNIHRLVIAGVTCASKFFSDVFYTNSRYAKVGGLPLVELNHLELQFLLLNDFRLSIPVEELEAYATMLVEFYAREVLAQRQNEGNDRQMEGVDTTATS